MPYVGMSQMALLMVPDLTVAIRMCDMPAYCTLEGREKVLTSRETPLSSCHQVE